MALSVPGRRSFAKIAVGNGARSLGFVSDSRRGRLSLATSSSGGDGNLLQLFNVVQSETEEQCVEVARLETDPKPDPWVVIEKSEVDEFMN